MEAHRTSDVTGSSPAYVPRSLDDLSSVSGRRYATEIIQKVDGVVLHTTCELPQSNEVLGSARLCDCSSGTYN